MFCYFPPVSSHIRRAVRFTLVLEVHMLSGKNWELSFNRKIALVSKHSNNIVCYYCTCLPII